MASYLQIENISKSYGPKVLFEHIDFNINEGDKVALIAPNGTGKTSLGFAIFDLVQQKPERSSHLSQSIARISWKETKSL